MKRNSNKVILLIVSIIFLVGTTIPAFATDNNVVTLRASDFNSSKELEHSISDYLSNSYVEEVIVLSENLDSPQYSSQEDNKSSEFNTRTTSPVYYQVKNVVRKSDVTGSSDLAIATGQPGVTVSISKTKSVSTTLSATFGATTSAISSAVGWNVTGSSSISISGSAKVPSTHNGKSVKTMTLHAKPVYKVKTFDVYRYVPGYVNTKIGTGTTKKAYGVSFTKTYVYK